MAGSTFGNIFRITTWGESHGKALGVVIDGCPAGLELNEDIIQSDLDKRKPGQSKFTTQRKESDTAEILSGVFEGKTTGTPISIMVKNADHHSADYSNISSVYRPGHADFTFDEKYGFRDYRGGGRSSGRETIGRVAAGAVAKQILSSLGISFTTYTKSIGPVAVEETYYKESRDKIFSNKLYMPDENKAKLAEDYILKASENNDSVGGIIECVIENVPTGLGDSVFDKISANLSKAICSIGAVKAFEIGDGIEVTTKKGSENNDEMLSKTSFATNHAGGILGGMTSGAPIILRAHIKPTPSISSTQNTIDTNGNQTQINIKGRHDPIIVPRAVVVVEAMAAITIVDALFTNMSAKLDNIIDFYK